MSECRYDRETDQYLTEDGEVCDTPRREHCTARRSCPIHLGWGELTCARCLGRTRQDIRQIAALSALMLPAAIAAGVDSEAANLAGPAADVEAWSWRKVAAKQGVSWHLSQVEDDDDWHPYTVLGRWAMMLTEDYGLTSPPEWTIASAAGFLERILTKVANDEDQDFRLLARELRRCRSHLDAVIRNSRSPEKGAPCPDCKADGHVVRMQRRYSHWCDDPDCERIHVDTDELDVWTCPRDEGHDRDMASYRRYVEERQGAPTHCA